MFQSAPPWLQYQRRSNIYIIDILMSTEMYNLYIHIQFFISSHPEALTDRELENVTAVFRFDRLWFSFFFCGDKNNGRWWDLKQHTSYMNFRQKLIIWENKNDYRSFESGLREATISSHDLHKVNPVIIQWDQNAVIIINNLIILTTRFADCHIYIIWSLY